MECEFPTINSNKDEVKEIFESVKTIAIVGLSPNKTKDSHKVAKYLQKVGYKIVPIYPKENIILGEKVYNSLLNVPFKIEMVDIFRKSDAMNDIVDVCIQRGDVKVVWSQIGIVNNEAAKKADNAGLKVVQNQCAMIDYKKIMEV